MEIKLRIYVLLLQDSDRGKIQINILNNSIDNIYHKCIFILLVSEKKLLLEKKNSVKKNVV